jgi:hypothetical protein
VIQAGLADCFDQQHLARLSDGPTAVALDADLRIQASTLRTSLEAVQAEAVLEFAVVVLNAPADLDKADQFSQRCSGGPAGQPVVGACFGAFGPLCLQVLLVTIRQPLRHRPDRLPPPLDHQPRI